MFFTDLFSGGRDYFWMPQNTGKCVCRTKHRFPNKQPWKIPFAKIIFGNNCRKKKHLKKAWSKSSSLWVFIQKQPKIGMICNWVSCCQHLLGHMFSSSLVLFIYFLSSPLPGRLNSWIMTAWIWVSCICVNLKTCSNNPRHCFVCTSDFWILWWNSKTRRLEQTSYMNSLFILKMAMSINSFVYMSEYVISRD